jgi:SPP1 gp7 family putative phage head morphogenesis protein
MLPNNEALDTLTDKKEQQMNKELIKIYQRSLKDTRSELAKIYEQYSVDGVLDYATMQKYNRLAGLEASITEVLKESYNEIGRVLTANLTDIYTTNYLYTGFILETMSQTKLAYALLPTEAIKKAIQNPISGLTLNQRLQKNRTEIILKTREQLTQGLIQGESIQKMSKRIKDLYENDTTKSLRIAQTETNRVRNEGKDVSYDKAKAKGVNFTRVWVSSLDSRTRDTHKKLDGTKQNKDGYFVIGRYRAKYPGGFGVAEMDINCRCTTRAEFKGFEPTVRRARGEGIIDYKTYDDWYNDRVSK